MERVKLPNLRILKSTRICPPFGWKIKSIQKLHQQGNEVMAQFPPPQKKHRMIAIYLLVVTIFLAPAFACTFTDSETTPPSGAEIVIVQPVLNAGAAAELVQVDFPVEVVQPSGDQPVAFEGGVVQVFVSFKDAPFPAERVVVEIRLDSKPDEIYYQLSRSMPFQTTEATVLLRWFLEDPEQYTIQAKVYLKPDVADPNKIPYNESKSLPILVLDNAQVALTQTFASVYATQTAEAIATATQTALLGLYCRAIVEIPDLNKRQGPGSNFRIVGQFEDEEEIQIVGRSPNGSWVYVRDSAGENYWANNNDDWITRDTNFPLCNNLPVIDIQDFE
jgi:hypothetical protein